MKKFLLYFAVVLLFLANTFEYANANDKYIDLSKSKKLVNDMQIQNKISRIGLKLLNANQIDVRVIFVYSDKDKKFTIDSGLTKRQITVYNKNLQFASNNDEIAAFIAREICKSAESYSGTMHGIVTSIQTKCAPKRYEIFFDKRAVDYMVKAGYNPLGLITYINKAYPQKRFDTISRSNLTSKRLANIYEYIYTKYPYYLAKNDYIKNESYQNFLLTSYGNRQKLHEKIMSGSKKAVKYE